LKIISNETELVEIRRISRNSRKNVFYFTDKARFHGNDGREIVNYYVPYSSDLNRVFTKSYITQVSEKYVQNGHEYN